MTEEKKTPATEQNTTTEKPAITEAAVSQSTFAPDTTDNTSATTSNDEAADDSAKYSNADQTATSTQEATIDTTAETATDAASQPFTSAPADTIHNSVDTDTDEAVVNQSTPTAVTSAGVPSPSPSQILSGLADNTYMSAATVPAYVLELRQAYETAIVNQHFLGDRKKVEKAIAALTLVDPETRVRAQLETNAYKTLRARAAKKAEEPGGFYVAPTSAAIEEYIEDGLKVWRDKQK